MNKALFSPLLHFVDEETTGKVTSQSLPSEVKTGKQWKENH